MKLLAFIILAAVILGARLMVGSRGEEKQENQDEKVPEKDEHEENLGIG